MKNEIKPQTLKGFNDYFSDDMRIRNFIRDSFRELAQEYGFEPLETPALEYSELILGQSGAEAEKLYYKFKDNGDRDVMLKYELMIPMCRAVAQNINKISFPYKRFQIQNVWRAENVQKGRMREFTQMDIDILGTASAISDAEIIQFGLDFLKKIGFKKYQVRLNSREIIQGLVDVLQIDKEKFEAIYIAIDKLGKIGEDDVRAELTQNNKIEKGKIDKLLEILKMNDLEKISEILASSESGEKGISNIKSILSILQKAGIEGDLIKFDLSLARGLASYTGAVWEFEVIDGNVGSVSGGGRYDKAVSKYIGREIPATGTSFGLERLTEIMKEKKIIDTFSEKNSTLIIPLDENSLEYSFFVASKLREKKIETTLFPDFTKLKDSLRYADRKRFAWVIIIGENEISNNTIQLKNMIRKEQFSIDIENAIKEILSK